MKLLRRRRKDLGEIRADNILWGVPRREGYSDTDDPLVHEGLVQHAFLMGQDDQALCGARPPRRLSRADRMPRAQLALAGPANPRCQKCEAALAAGTIGSPSTFMAQARPEPSAAAGPDQPGQAAAPAPGKAAAPAPGKAAAPAPAVTDAPEPVPAASESATGEPADDQAAGESADSEPAEDKAGDKPGDDGDDGDVGEPADGDVGEPADGAADAEPADEPQTEEPADSAADAEPADDAADAERADEQQTEEQADLLVASHPSTRVRRGGLITIPAGRKSVLAELPASAHDAAIAAEIDGGAAQVRVQAVALNDDGTLRITLNQPTTESIDVMWFVV